MGYTHYWRVPNEPDADTFKVWGKEVDTIINACADVAPVHDVDLTDDLVFFNGGHETFVVARVARDFKFCKTARKPYDLVVTACLLRLQEHFPEIDVSSDGEMAPDNDEWGPAYDLVA